MEKISHNTDVNGYKFNHNLCDTFEGQNYLNALDIPQYDTMMYYMMNFH